VGAAGAGYIAGGRFGIGKVAGMGYMIGKVGERATRRGLGATRDASVRNFAGAAKAQDTIHSGYQKAVGAAGSFIPFAGGTATGMIAKDQAAQERAKKEAIDARQKKYGDNLKSLDWKRLTQGDNVDKAIALRAAAEQHDLGKPELMKHFTAASTVMSQGDVKDLTNQNLSFNTLTSENVNKRSKDDFKNKDGSPDKAAQLRIEESMTKGMSEEEAAKHEIMTQAAVKAIEKGDDTKVQGLENETDAVAMVDAYRQTDQLNKLGDKPILHKKSLKQGVTAHVKTIEGKRQKATTDDEKKVHEDNKMTFAGAAIKTGANVDDALAADQTLKRGGKEITDEGSKDYERHANQLFAESVESSDIIGMSKDDRKAHGFRATTKAITGVGKKRDSEKLDDIKESLTAAKESQLKKNSDITQPAYQELVNKETVANKVLD
jgi:hypothetical protein